MYLVEAKRGEGIAEQIINKLESYAIQNNVHRICLETGNKHFAAIKFYEKLGYTQIERFGKYEPNDVSVYFERTVLK